MEWTNLIDMNQIIAWRRWLHQHPELAFKEVETSKFIKEQLEKMENIEISQPTPTSVLGVLKGGKPGKTIGLRADIDALPIDEESDVEFKSLNSGVMHACGHDTHAAMLLGAASVLSQIQSEVCGTVKFVFQHAEEGGPGGAGEIVATGCLDDVDMFYGSHIYPLHPVGLVASAPGPILAASDRLALEIQGRGAHGSTPQASIDPIMIGSSIVMNINQIVSRNISPMDNVVISMGKFVSGTAVNIIPDKAELMASIRTYTPEMRDLAENRLMEVVDGVCKAHGAEYKFDYKRGYDAVRNDPACVEIVKNACHKYISEKAYITMPKQMGSEDFSAYLTKAPGAYAIIGGGAVEDGYIYGNHHPKFKIDERALMIGTKMYIGFIMEANK